MTTPALTSDHVTLIRPPAVPHMMSLAPTYGAPPLALACLAGALKEGGYRVTAIDAIGEAMEQFTRIDRLPFHSHGLTADQIVDRIPKDTGMIGVSCMFSNEWIYHRRVINLVTQRFPNVPVVVGGEHATASPDYVLRSCPGVIACCLGEGEDTILDLLDALRNGRPLNEVGGLMIRGGADGAFTPRRTKTCWQLSSGAEAEYRLLRTSSKGRTPSNNRSAYPCETCLGSSGDISARMI